MVHDGVIRIELSRYTFLLGYADYIAAVMSARNLKEGQGMLNQVMAKARK